MSQGTVLQTMAGALLSISATLPESYDEAGYESTDFTGAWNLVGQIENFGNHGGSANVSTFTAVADSVVQKFKGAKNYGTMNVVVGNLPSDAGQAIIDAAFESPNRYSVKIEYPLRAGEVTKETHYLDVLVTQREWQDGAVDDPRKVNCTLEVCRAPVVVDAT